MKYPLRVDGFPAGDEILVEIGLDASVVDALYRDDVVGTVVGF